MSTIPLKNSFPSIASIKPQFGSRECLANLIITLAIGICVAFSAVMTGVALVTWVLTYGRVLGALLRDTWVHVLQEG